MKSVPLTMAQRATNSAPSWRCGKDPDRESLPHPPPLSLLSPGFILPGPSLPLCPANSHCPPGSSPRGGPRWPHSGYCPNACGEESTNWKTGARAERREEPALVKHSHHHHRRAPPCTTPGCSQEGHRVMEAVGRGCSARGVPAQGPRAPAFASEPSGVTTV